MLIVLKQLINFLSISLLKKIEENIRFLEPLKEFAFNLNLARFELTRLTRCVCYMCAVLFAEFRIAVESEQRSNHTGACTQS